MCLRVALACCFQLVLLQLPVPCQHVFLTSCLCREAGGGYAGQACSPTNTEQEFAAMSLSYTCGKSPVSTVVKCVLLLWLSFPFSWISPRNSACLFWGTRNFAVWMFAQVVMVSHLGSMSLVTRSGLCMANMTVKTDRFQNFKFWI